MNCGLLFDKHLPFTQWIYRLVIQHGIMRTLMFAGILAWICLCTLYFLQYKVLVLNPFNGDELDAQGLKAWRNSRQELQSNSSRQKKALLLGYMRGGSTLFSELFRQNEEAMFWYEPYDAFYNAYFGQITFHFPADIFWYQQYLGHSTIRNITDWETSMLAEFSHHLFTCDFSRLPAELFTHTAVSLSRLGPLRHCIASQTKDSHLDNCRTAIVDKCSGNIARSLANDCPFQILQAMNSSHQQQGDEWSDDILPEFLEYVKCRDIFSNNYIQKCLQDLKTRCHSKRLIVLKALRLNFETVKSLLEKDPDLYILYLVRDPRSIVSSRVDIKFTYRDTYNNPVLVAKYLCQRMLHDLRIFSQLKRQYPNALKMIKYEDLVLNREDTVSEIYQFLDDSVHPSVNEWLRANSVKQPDNDQTFSTSRKNSSQSISKWRIKIPRNQHNTMNDHCREVLNQLNYSIK